MYYKVPLGRHIISDVGWRKANSDDVSFVQLKKTKGPPVVDLWSLHGPRNERRNVQRKEIGIYVSIYRR